MQTKKRLASLGLSCLLLASAPAISWADQPSASPDSKATAGEALAEKAYTLYHEGQFIESLAAYQRAYEMTGASVVLFNIANIYDLKLRELELAGEYYRRYLRAPDATPELVRKSNERLEGLKLQALPPPQSSAKPAPAPAHAPDAPAESGSAWRTTGLVVGGLGLVSLGVSGAFALHAGSKDSDADRYCNSNSECDPAGIELGDEANSAATVSTVTFIGGLAALTAGAVLFFAAPSRAAPAKTARGVRAAPSLGPQTAGFVLAGSW